MHSKEINTFVRMFHVPNYQQNLSLRLSEVLDDIGVNEGMVLKTRRSSLLKETMRTITYRFINNKSMYMFGSSSESTTTYGLKSDSDILHCDLRCNVIQDLADWKHGFTNLLMIQDNTTSPGYCLLQLIYDDVPLPTTHVLNEFCVRDGSGRVLLKNTLYRLVVRAHVVKHGPAWTHKGGPGISDMDNVPAFCCKSWPYESRAWLDRQGIGRWPTADMKRFAENNGCFVVSVGSKVSQNPEIEWRISTSQAERCLMFSLNITQIRCYVLMKMILKTFLNHAGEGHISSFMCKTVLLHCIENTHSNAWQENNIFTCLSCCLHVLYNCLQQENCPHFITPGNNLMAGQFLPEVKALLLERMLYLIQSDGQALLGIQIDDLGQRLQIELNAFDQIAGNIKSKHRICLLISGTSLFDTARILNGMCCKTLSETIRNSHITIEQHLLTVIEMCVRYYTEGSTLEQKASTLLAPIFSSTLGTVIASLNIQTNNTIPQEALDWLSAGFNSDVASSRLKLASVFYSVGNIVKTESILKDTEGCYGFYDVEPVCGCYDYSKYECWENFALVANHQNEEAIKSVCAFCVKFISAEIHCVPRELHYELYRLTRDDMRHRDDCFNWMDLAVVDSLPYLYFLQYKTYGHLHRFDEQHQALTNLVRTIKEQPNLGHRETALNLLGQCMEQENQPNKALHCYITSLKVRGRHNVAKIHICKLLASLVRKKVCV